MKIYLAEYEYYDYHNTVGFFLEESKAEECCKYLNRTDIYCGKANWDVCEYELDETDYASLNKELDDKERLEFESRLEREKQKELAELARLKAKYE